MARANLVRLNRVAGRCIKLKKNTPNTQMIDGGQDYDYQTAKKLDFSNLDQDSLDKRNKT